MTEWRKRLVSLALSALVAMPAAAFDLTSGEPIAVSADHARLDDAKGTATYTGDVVVTQKQTKLTADRVVLYRDEAGVNRIEASGNPAHYQQPATDGSGETRASALNITYSAKDNALIFEQEAVINQQGNLFKGDRIFYDTKARVVTAESKPGDKNSTGRVEMVIQPRNKPQPASGPDTTDDRKSP
ncbi:MAG: lipopolysaccharide transport periplasmic protein LptA [Marinobacter sp.]|nr:lipopolysaccharide transport periplasmic protein LptA [Marinobacter sp.]